MNYQNADLLKVESDRSVIPAYTLSFAENALYIAEAIERDFNSLFMNIGINELAVYESTGSQIVYEGENLASLKKKAIDFMKSVWAKIKAGFETILTKFEAMKAEARKEMAGKLTAADVDTIEDGKTFGKVHQFNGLDKVDYGTKAKALIDSIKNDFAGNAGVDNAKENIAQTKEEIDNTVCAKVSGIDGVTTVKDMVSKIRESLTGDEVEVDKAFLKSNLDTITKVVIEGTTKNTIKTMYQETKKYIDDCISSLNKLDERNADLANSELSIFKTVLQCMNSANNAAMDVCKRRFAEYKNVFVKVYVATGKRKQKATNEGAESVISKQEDLIESAFEW